MGVPGPTFGEFVQFLIVIVLLGELYIVSETIVSASDGISETLAIKNRPHQIEAGFSSMVSQP